MSGVAAVGLVNPPEVIPFTPKPQVKSEYKSVDPAAYRSTDRLNLSFLHHLEQRQMTLINFPEDALVQHKDLPKDLQALRQSADFNNVYRNFDLLPKHTQKDILGKLMIMLNKHPDFLQQLQRVDNPEYGDGFQFFFIPPETHDRWAPIPASVRGTGGYTDYIGIVVSHPIINFIDETGTSGSIRKALNYMTLGATNLVEKVIKSDRTLDVGGMFTNIGADTFTHEMGHVMHAYTMTPEEKLEIWAIFSQAEESGKGFITDYAKTNHFEFFAEGVEAYLYQNFKGEFTQRAELKKVNPLLYDFVERLLEPGVERKNQNSAYSTWLIAKTKSANALEAVKKLGLDNNHKKACHCGQNGH